MKKFLDDSHAFKVRRSVIKDHRNINKTGVNLGIIEGNTGAVGE